MQIAILLFDRLTALDAVGPYEVLGRLPKADVRFVATEPGPKRTDLGSLALVADHSLDDVAAPDIVVVPGGPGEKDARRDERLLAWIRRVHETTQWTTSVCTGALILAEAGVLAGVPATTHWTAFDELALLGAEPIAERVVVEGKIVTAAGVSAGIDMALTLAAMVEGDLFAQGIQLGIEYDPQPPFDAGSPEHAPPVVVELLRSRSRFARR